MKKKQKDRKQKPFTSPLHGSGKELLPLGRDGTGSGLYEFLLIKIQHCRDWIMFNLFKSPSYKIYIWRQKWEDIYTGS